jgi:hypothetical protein
MMERPLTRGEVLERSEGKTASGWVKVGKREQVKRQLKGFSVALVMKFCRTRICSSGGLRRITNFGY